MLGKLIKYDFKSLSRVLVPALIAILVAAPLIGGFLHITGMQEASELPELVRIISGFMTFLLIVGISAACILIFVAILQRFYKSTVTSEGYLTFTLPVTSGKILWSKLIVAMIWSVITAVVLFVALNLFLLIMPTFGNGTNAFTEMWRAIGELFENYFTGATALVGVELIIITILSLAGNFLEFFLAIIIGGVVSQKHKVLAGIGFYFVINAVEGILTSAVMQATLLSNIAFGNNAGMNVEMHIQSGSADIQTQLANTVADMQPFILLTFAITAVFAVACFVLCNYLMKNKLNLE